MGKENLPEEGEEVMEEKSSSLDKLDLGGLSSLLKNVDISQVMNLLNTVDISQLASLFGSSNRETNVASGKRRSKEVEVLSAIKPMVNSQRGELIDMILQVYAISKILK